MLTPLWRILTLLFLQTIPLIYLFHFPVDGYNSSTTSDKPPRSMSQTKSSSRKSKLSLSSSIKQKHGKSSGRHKESKWYLDTRSSASFNTNNNNNNSNENNFTTLSTFSASNIDRPSRKLVSEIFDDLILVKTHNSTTSSQCSTPNEHSIARAIFDINSMLISIGLGRSTPTSSISTPQHQPVLLRPRKKNSSTLSHQTSSSSVTDESDYVNISYRARSAYSPARPNSLILSSQPSSQKKTNDIDDDNEHYYSAQSSKLSTPMIHTVKDTDGKDNLTSIVNVDHDEQKIPQIKLFQPQNEDNSHRL
ncbi:unnamed protein product [Adineta ricciae]|uniref:Uncharacterized protein n=1 Tax=Adineta ricciae TaxID=249248 RepID=A0A813NQC9_ADIRI|nr:unnamed protein product [Adineta ricciae]